MGGLVGSPREMLDFVRSILKSRVSKLIYLSKRRRRRKLEPEAVPTIVQHVPQSMDSTQRQHSITRTVKSERGAVTPVTKSTSTIRRLKLQLWET